MLKKNDIVNLKIEDMSSDGAGIGKIDGYPVFVKDAVIGDQAEAKVVKAKKNYAFGRLMQIVEPSPFRVEPRCPVAKQCGGCQIQALDYGKQLEFKQNKVRNNLERIGKLEGIQMEPILGMEDPWNYRNKAQYPVGKTKDGEIVAGFYAGRTHSIIPITDCSIGSKSDPQVLEAVLRFMKDKRVEPYDEETGRGVVRHVLIRIAFKTGEIMVCLVSAKAVIPGIEELVADLKQINGMTSICVNVNKENTNVILGKETHFVWGKEYITDYIGDVEYRISPLSFYQVNPVQTKVLYEKALEFAGLTGNEVVWDLYCGIGTISLFLAKRAKKVYGVEVVPEAIEDAKVNAGINGIENVEFFVGKAEEVFPEKYRERKERAEVVVVDPPRKGCDESLLDTIVEMAPERVVYVSCDSATLGRDLKYLVERGYEVRKVQAVDMFGSTVHVETVVLMSRVDS